MELHELHEHVRRFERNRTKGRHEMIRIIEPESVCPWCGQQSKYIKSRSDFKGRNTGVHVFYCVAHGYYESRGGKAKGKAIPPNEV